MTWIRLDDHFDENPKLAGVGPLGLALWVSALAYCNRNLTDGYVPISVARTLIDCSGITVGWFPEYTHEDAWLTMLAVLDELVKVGLLDKLEVGYMVHDYLSYQPSKADVLTERARKQAAGQAGGLASAQARGQANYQRPAQAKSNPTPVPVPNVPNPTPVRAQSANGWNEEAQTRLDAGEFTTYGEALEAVRAEK